jgi:sulfate adenylyltransferase subunit 2
MSDVTMNHLECLEAESIHIMREMVAECENPVVLYSVGKDSAMMLDVAMNAFFPSKPPLPLLHIDTLNILSLDHMYRYIALAA